MSMINYASREINCKLVYYGPGLGGKTTNLEHIYRKVSPDTRGKMVSLATETERTTNPHAVASAPVFRRLKIDVRAH